MNLYMLDTDIAPYIIRGDHPEIIESFRKNFRNICVSAITTAELQYGAMKKNSQSLIWKVFAFGQLVKSVAWTAKAASAYAVIRSDIEKQGTPIGAMDMLIAASAVAEEAILVTNNTQHFSRVKDLKIENWCQ